MSNTQITATATTFGLVRQAMHRLNSELAPGGECNQWQEYVADCSRQFGWPGYDQDHDDDVVPGEYASYWLAIADQDYDLAGSYGDVPDSWID